MDNHEPWSVPEKGLQRAKKQSVLEFFVPMHSVSFLTRKNPPDPLSDNSAFSPDLFPECSA